MSIPLVRGRRFTAEDRVGAPRVCLINQELARRHFPGVDPIGQRLMIMTMADTPDAIREIVGVVGDVRPAGPQSGLRSQVHEPVAQYENSFLTLALIFGSGLRIVALGVAAGLAGAVALARLLQTMLYQTSPADPLTLGAVALLLAVVACFACWLPARRATKVDPIIALRAE